MNPMRKALLGGAVVASTLTGGALGAAFLGGSAGAATTSSTTPAAATAEAPASATAPTGTPPQGQAPRGPHQANGITETVLTGDKADKATAAAKAAVPGATLERVETDADGATYEAHVTKSDGTRATVLMDADFKVTSVEDGMGGGAPRG